MSSTVMNDDTLYLGVDGGGTKCRACLVSSSGEVLGTGLAGPANPLHGLTRTLASITEAAEQAAASAGLPQLVLKDVVAGVALAGINLPGMFVTMSEWQHPFAEMHLTTDLHAACLGAHRGGDGAVIVVGTGSCGFVSVKGQSATLGGHGFLLGDMGSGAWMGLEAIKAVLKAEDGLSLPTTLVDQVTDIYGVNGLQIVERMSKASSSEFARLAPSVLAAAAAGDDVARAIVAQGAGYIDDLAKKLLLMAPPRLSMLGGISAPLQKWLSDDVSSKVQPPLEQPEMGAVYFARERHGLSATKALA
ncbi:ATPase [Aestuariicella hydrocarbonica]|uniref:ATPase n=1 Tax=Pseudomaricurvus hydrocarbonicus TaxID=1470433 RepID=A0A9E5JT06_9GAMM|nr:BadF/BadG/BcrA/BcrD ATPase family protein [Aestuariicella hydrocarbonica]NHO65023.1 ATPase [Aestuariicella hydrocarbonica]